MIGKNIAPGLNRSFAFEKWPCCGAGIAERARAAARSVIRSDEEAGLRIYASDIDYFAIRQAKENARLAGVEGCIHFQKLDYTKTASRYRQGFLITNPPYGERLEDAAGVRALYRGMARILKRLRTGRILLSRRTNPLKRSSDERRTNAESCTTDAWNAAFISILKSRSAKRSNV